MAFAWAFFYGFRWMIGRMGASAFHGDDTMLCVVLALVLSALCIASIFALDHLADAEWTGDEVDDAIREIIRVMGILIGFSWEQTFDAAEGALAAVLPCPHLAKLGFACFSVVILIPAWRFHLLPMVVSHGYKFGFILSDVDKDWGGVHMLVKAIHDHHKDLLKERSEGRVENVEGAECTKCGSLLKADAKFCRMCGAKVEESQKHYVPPDPIDDDHRGYDKDEELAL